MVPGFGGLPPGSHKWGVRQWATYHHEQADAVGCIYDPKRVADGPLLIASGLKHTEGVLAGESFHFLPWFLHRVVHPFYGYIDPSTDLRRYRRCYLFVAKKNSKTTSMGPLLLHHLTNDGEMGARVFSAAGSVEQASEVYDVAAPMVVDSPDLSRRLTIRDANRRIVFPKTHSWYQVLSAEVATKHGLKPSCVHFDELHAQPNRNLWEVLTVGASAGRAQPALFATSTAGYDRHGICYEEWQYARRVRDGMIYDPQLLPVIYEMSEAADWKDEEAWYAANPSLGTLDDLIKGNNTTITIEDMRAEFRKALEVPANENSFRMLRLNQWVSQETRFIPMHAWDACAPLPASFAGRRWFGGLDLSTTTDLTAWGRVSFDGDWLDIDAHGWIPGENIEDRERRDRVPYREWSRLGFVTICPGPVIDYGFVANRIDEDARRDGRPVEIGFDPYNARQFCEVELPAMGFEMFAVPQTPSVMTSPAKKLLEAITAGRMRGAANPLLRWAAENMMVKADSNGNVKPDKAKASGRIDPIVAVIDALDRASRHVEAVSTAPNIRYL